MSKHTPGPWIKKDGYLMGSNGRDVVASGIGLGLGADCGDGVRNANARLISAAPELLQALQNLIEAAESMKGTYTFVQGETPEDDNEYGHEKWAEEFLQEMVDAARAAIAKATGEQS